MTSPKYPLIEGAAERLREVADHIERHPEEYDQLTWFDGLTVQAYRENGIGACGSAACIGGHLVARDASRSTVTSKRHVEDRAERLLVGTDRVALSLFYGTPENAWPEPWASRWAEVPGLYATDDVRQKAYAQIAADYLRHIADEGWVE